MQTRVSTKGQVVLPSPIRRKLGLRAGDPLNADVEGGRIVLTPRRTRSKTAGLDFSVEDKLDTPRFNHVLWEGLKGEGVPYPEERSRRNWRRARSPNSGSSGFSHKLRNMGSLFPTDAPCCSG